MILYNVTINIDSNVHDEWLKWMKEVHIPDVLATGMFVESKIARILAEEEGGKAYSIQYFAEIWKTTTGYQKEFAPKLQADHQDKYNGKFGAFRTLLHIVHESHAKS